MSDAASPQSMFFLSQRQRLHYLDWGNHDAPPLLLLHGGRDHCHSWDPIASDLSRDWRVIVPDLRGHGDSDWAMDGVYTMASFVYDLAELIHQLAIAPLRIVAHSLGGNISLRYAGIYPENVTKIVAIEGLGLSPVQLAERQKTPLPGQMRTWIEERRKMAASQPRRYSSFEDALARMRAKNDHLTLERASYLVRHGMRRNEDGTYSWKFDNYMRHFSPPEIASMQPEEHWRRITAPVLLVYGAGSWTSNPSIDGRAAHFQNARVAVIGGAGHWVHHDRQEEFTAELRGFL